jgi:DNA-binding MarR family transcriptional regulator
MKRQQAARRASTEIGTALYGLATRAVRRLPRELSLTSAATLATLDRTGPRRITDLAVTEGVTQPAMSVVVRMMEKSGLVERRNDPSDKRVTLVRLTEAGASYVKERRRAGVDAYVRLIDELTDEEAEALEAALPALLHLEALDRQDREGPDR